MTAEIVCVGTELLLGDVVNTNASDIARRLAELGINVYYQSVVGDNPDRLRDLLSKAVNRSDVVIVTGGLGPTYDDITKETAAEVLGLPLEMDAASESKIHKMLDDLQIPFTDNNAKQAMIPKGAVLLENTCGTAPGILLERGSKMLFLLPGPPHEMAAMLESGVVPVLEKRSDTKLKSHSARIFGIGEAAVESVLHDEMVQMTNPTIAPYVKNGEVELRVTARGSTEEECEALMQPVLLSLCERFPNNLYGIDVPNLQTALVDQLLASGLHIATAESCTGGLISSYITDVPGASDVFECGICSYADRIKHDVLGVSWDTLNTWGAVSAQTAAEMAQGVLHLAGADISVSTTGLAGPSGGTPATPIGTVFVGVATAQSTQVHELHLPRTGPDAREWIRHRAASHALFRALQTISNGHSSAGIRPDTGKSR